MQNIHPLFIHFPIALLSVGLLSDILGSVFKKESLRNSGWWSQVFGIVSIIGTAITGLLAASTVGHTEGSHEIMEMHKTLELSAVGMFTLLFIWRVVRKTILPQMLPFWAIYFILGISALGMMFYGAHLGGRLVYEFGVGGSAVPQSEGAGYQHNHDKDKADESESRYNHDTGAEGSIKDRVSSPADTATEKQKKNHIHKGGEGH